VLFLAEVYTLIPNLDKTSGYERLVTVKVINDLYFECHTLLFVGNGKVTRDVFKTLFAVYARLPDELIRKGDVLPAIRALNVEWVLV
jgi:hypothetical protein